MIKRDPGDKAKGCTLPRLGTGQTVLTVLLVYGFFSVIDFFVTFFVDIKQSGQVVPILSATMCLLMQISISMKDFESKSGHFRELLSHFP